MDLSTLLILLPVAPLVMSLIMFIMPPSKVSLAAYECMHVLSIAAVGVLGIYLVYAEFTSGEAITAVNMWFRIDSLSAIFVALIAVIGLLVGIFSIPYIRQDVEEEKLNQRMVRNYYAFFSLFLFTMLLTAISNNIIMMWVCVEATTLATVFLVGVYETKLALEAAWKYVIVCTAGVAFGLYGTLLVYANAADVMADNTQAALWTAIVPIADQLDPTLMAIAFTFIVIGFGTKAGLFPMHTWLPDAHSEAPSPVSALLSGVLLKCAVLMVIRFYIIIVQCIGTTYPSILLITLAIIGICVAAVSMYRQSDIKRMLAYSSVENICIVFLALGFGGPIGIAACLLHCVFHGLTKALMFCLSGNLLMKYDTRDLEKIQGVAEVAPATATLLCIGFFTLGGFPPFAVFTSEVATFLAGFAGGFYAILVILAIALTVVVAAVVRVVAKSVFSKAPADKKKGDVPAMALVPEILLAILVVWFGVAMPQPLADGVDNATSIVLQEEVDILDSGSLLSDLAAEYSEN